MKKNFMKIALFMVVVFGLLGCENGTSEVVSERQKDRTSQTEIEDVVIVLPDNILDAIDAPKSVLSPKLKDAITYMYSEEGLAHDVYLDIYKKQVVNQLKNIATNSEVKHIDAVNKLAIKYDLNMTQYPDTNVPYSIDGIENGKYPVEPIQDLYNLLYDKGIQSKQDALEVGCMVEVVDIDDLDKYIEYAQKDNASDVLNVFNFLRNGSYTHYWAFNDGLVNKGVSDGCCSLGTEWCHPEYPKK